MFCKQIVPVIIADRPRNLLDIGAGHSREATDQFLTAGIKVSSLDIKDYRQIDHPNHTFIEANFMGSGFIWDEFDAVVASHVMEHIQDTGEFLQRVRKLLTSDGTFYCIVPPLKHAIVGGHVHLWNMGLLMYNLILGGFDVRNGRFKKDGYNLMACVKKNPRPLPELRYDNGDIETLKDFWPDDPMYKQGFDGQIDEYNWR